MRDKIHKEAKAVYRDKKFRFTAFFIFIIFFIIFFAPRVLSLGNLVYEKDLVNFEELKEKIKPKYPALDEAEYDRRMELLANNPPYIAPEVVEGEVLPPPPVYPWPVKNLSYPKNGGAILPFNRVIAYYGNLYSRKMGALGEYDEEEMLAKLQAEVDAWNQADPETPALPALHYIAVVAQASAGADGKYRARMPFSEIDKVLAMAEKIDAIVFLDLQVGFSTAQIEVPLLEEYLKLPNVHLGLDPEFSMKGEHRPGKAVGTYDATDINFAVDYLASLVDEYDLPPKILVIHRFTDKMVTNYRDIKITPEVQVVMHMDGWGSKARKKNTYSRVIIKEPVQFTGFKIFYKNDLKEEDNVILSPEELLDLSPKPIYIQYQ